MLSARFWAVVVVTAGCAGTTSSERGPPDRGISARVSSLQSGQSGPGHSARTVHIDPAIDTLIRDNNTSSAPGTDQMTSSAATGYTSTTDTTKVTQDGDECIDTQERSAQLSAQDIAVFYPGAGVVFPGSLVALNGIEDGRLDSRNVRPANRQPFTVAISEVESSAAAPNASERIVRPGYGALQAARIKLIDTSTILSTNFSYTLHEYHTAEQALLSAGTTPRWIPDSVFASMSRNTSRYKTGLVLSFLQRYYTMAIQPPAEPSALFRDVSAQQLADAWRDLPANPIGYVGSVSYGRWALLTAESTRNEEQLKAALDAAIEAAMAGGTTELSADDRAILADSKLQLVVLGAREVTVTAIAEDDIVVSLKQMLGSSDDDQVRLGVPISFRVNYLHDNSARILQSTTSFRTQQRRPFVLENFRIYFHTNDAGKDRDTALDAWVWDSGHPVISGSDHTVNEYKDGSDHDFELTGSISARRLAGKLLRICISPRGRDTWKFDVKVTASNSYRASFTGLELDQDHTCKAIQLPATGVSCQ